MDALVSRPSTAARVFVVDDHPMFRAGVRSALRDVESLEVVGEASTGQDAVEALRVLEPGADVVLVNLQLPDRSGIEVTRIITSDPPRVGTNPRVIVTRVIVTSFTEDDDAVVAALRAGASGYLAKKASDVELRRAIETVADGGAVFGPMVAARLSAYFASILELPVRLAFPELTEREREILDLIARGHDNRHIARTLVLSEKTVRNHVSRVFMKLNVSRRTEAAVRARDAGLGR